MLRGAYSHFEHFRAGLPSGDIGIEGLTPYGPKLSCDLELLLMPVCSNTWQEQALLTSNIAPGHWPAAADRCQLNQQQYMFHPLPACPGAKCMQSAAVFCVCYFLLGVFLLVPKQYNKGSGVLCSFLRAIFSKEHIFFVPQFLCAKPAFARGQRPCQNCLHQEATHKPISLDVPNSHGLP